ncbi:hypothetical protein NQ318_008818 [Aromia moschata]|uniref:Chitin deacetylase n=1 Tax=Aromia moschata TaxID=1265417 RepID=A0AAV8ZC47_9CUCU|nr:hypothetical protein NQ318_008818 [Aromia moschata]
MKTIALLVICLASALPLISGESANCTSDNCLLSNGCRCSSSESPLGSDQVIPQFISLTFEDSISEALYTNYLEPLLFNRTNPDGKRIGATFFVPHEYTNYQKVNSLYNHGFEIAVLSVTNNPLQTYWRSASEEVLEQEFGEQKHIISKFANIPAEDIVGVRTPQLQLAGNRSIQAYINAQLTYDSSWPTLHTKPLFPYTLDYLSTQQCNLGTECPNESFKGFWVLPIVDLIGENADCNTLASCKTKGTADEIAEWLVGEVEQVRQSTRVPLDLLVGENWFSTISSSWEGFNKALNTLSTYSDVYFVSQKQVLDWMKNPVPLSSYSTQTESRNAECNEYSCELKKEEEATDIYMTSCIACPEVYPWLGKPRW